MQELQKPWGLEKLQKPAKTQAVKERNKENPTISYDLPSHPRCLPPESFLSLSSSTWGQSKAVSLQNKRSCNTDAFCASVVCLTSPHSLSCCFLLYSSFGLTYGHLDNNRLFFKNLYHSRCKIKWNALQILLAPLISS